jgi:hypothetical protein
MAMLKRLLKSSMDLSEGKDKKNGMPGESTESRIKKFKRERRNKKLKKYASAEDPIKDIKKRLKKTRGRTGMKDIASKKIKGSRALRKQLDKLRKLEGN